MGDLHPSACRTQESCVNLATYTRRLFYAQALLAEVSYGPSELTHLVLVPCAASQLGRIIAPPAVTPSHVLQPVLPATALPGNPLTFALALNDTYPSSDLGAIAAALETVGRRLVVVAALIPSSLSPGKQRLVLPVSVRRSLGALALRVSFDLPVLPGPSMACQWDVVFEELSLAGMSLLNPHLPKSVRVVRVCHDTRRPGAAWYAARAGDLPALLAALLDGGSTGEADGYETLLRVAIRRGRPDMITALVRTGAAVVANRDDAMTPLCFAVSLMKAECVAALLEATGIDVNAGCGSPQGTALHMACRNEYVAPCLRLLIAAPGIDVDASDSNGETALHVAAAAGVSEAVSMLLAAGASPHARDFGGEMPLHRATTAPCLTSLLAAPRIDVNASTMLGLTPLHVAVSRGTGDVVVSLACLQALLSAPGLNPNPRNADGDTPLLLAAMQGREWAVKALLDANIGVDAGARNRGGYTPQGLAEMHGHATTAALLKRAEAVSAASVQGACGGSTAQSASRHCQ